MPDDSAEISPKIAAAIEGRRPPAYRRGSRLFKVAGVNLTLVLVGVVAFELAFGNWLSPFAPPHFAIVSRTIKYQQNLYQPPGEVLYVRDRYGLRGVREPLRDVKVVTVGGSTTDQKFISEGQTWQDVSRDLSGVAIANAGIDGMTSTGHVLVVGEWLQKIPDFRPAYYVHYVGINDSSLSRLAAGRREDLWAPVRARSAIDRMYRQLEANIRIWIRGPATARHSPLALSDWIDREFVLAEGNRGNIVSFIAGTYRPNLHKLLAMHRRNGDRAIFMSQPFNPLLVTRKGEETYVRIADFGHVAIAIGMLNVVTKAVCAEQAGLCHFIDIAGAVTFDPGDFYDEVHTTPAGNRKVGAALARELARLR